MFAPGRIVIGQQDNIGTLQEGGVFQSPFLGAAGAAGCGEAQAADQVDFFLALGNANRLAGGDCFQEVRELIGRSSAQRC